MARIRRRPRGGPSRIERSDSAHAAWKSIQAELKGRKGEDTVREVLTASGLPCLHDIRLPKASGDGMTQIDHLALLPHAIMVIETKHYAGHLSGHPNDDYWRQRLGTDEEGRLIYSPLRQNDGHCAAVRSITCQSRLDIEILNRVVLTGRATVSPDLKPVVRDCDALKAELILSRGVIPGSMMGAWQRILRVVRHHPAG
ncbi:nuclease-related domain-containing protein [Gluconobacter oxydans]|uniref:NERD domain-containing protein n=1 Tax=Gluconobacter oxydans TaxID=442 RepID=A0AB35ANH0_GLUOY|nr:nuclease-related domain-containing protein [Gluconobacter oxydans]MBF0856570.1 NERD domain-containing protein [Gluconobacter oxydans]TCW25545.1 nuclease-like protein [Gluconobacter oxydans]